VENCSTDGSGELAENYASRFPGKIRLLRTKSFLSQVQNYNFALSCISPSSKYCKMVQADDWLFPDCLRSMVDLAEAHPAVGIVAAYALEGDRLRLDGLPYPSHEVPGRESCRLYLLKGKYLFGSPTSILLRSELVRSRTPFFDEQYAPYEDALACFDLLKTWNFGFVHQVLTYSRSDQESIFCRARRFGFLFLCNLTIVVTHGRDYLSAEEYKDALAYAERQYFLFLTRCALRGRSKEFWEIHRKALASLNYSLNWRLLAKWVPGAFLEKSWEAFWLWWDKRYRILPDDLHGAHL
jgi:glycosyltransferase involved in cell wall biosynthesis